MSIALTARATSTARTTTLHMPNTRYYIMHCDFLAMFINCACASFVDKRTQSLSSRTLIDVYHCCCFDQSTVDSRCTFARQEHGFQITGRASGSRIKGSASGTAINSLCVQYTSRSEAIIPRHFAKA